MKRPLLQLVLFCLIHLSVFSFNAGAQSRRAANLFLEAGGNGGIASVNYDWRFSSRNDGFGARVGLGLVGENGHFSGRPIVAFRWA